MRLLSYVEAWVPPIKVQPHISAFGLWILLEAL